MVKFESLQKKLYLFQNPSEKKINRKSILKAFYLQKRLQNTSPSKKKNHYKKILNFSKNYFKLSKNCSDNDLLCPICMDYLIEPRTTICGHSFCEKCFFESMLKFNFCPICKKKIKKKTNCFSKSLSTLIKNYQKTLSPEILQTYKTRILENKAWKSEKKVKLFKIGSKYDIKDTENIWCVAELKKITKNKNHADTLLFHYLGWNQIFDEYICANSERIAPLGLFTGRNDLPKYNRGENRHLMDYILWERNFVGEINQFFPEMRGDIEDALLENRRVHGVDRERGLIGQHDAGNLIRHNDDQNHIVNNQNPNHIVNNENPNHIVNNQNHIVNNENQNHIVTNENPNHIVNNQNHIVTNDPNIVNLNNENQNNIINNDPNILNLNNNNLNEENILENNIQDQNNNEVLHNSNNANNDLNGQTDFGQRIFNQLMDEIDREENWNN